MSDTYEAKAAILAVKEHSNLPFVVTFTFDEEGKLLSGADVETAMIVASSLGASAVGFNCGWGLRKSAPCAPRPCGHGPASCGQPECRSSCHARWGHTV